MPDYTKPQGWVESPFWETYALNFADQDSDQALSAALSHSVPQDFLNSYTASHPNTKGGDANNPNALVANMDARKLGKEHADGGLPGSLSAGQQRLRNTDKTDILNRYSQALQKRLAKNFNDNQASYLDRGKANLYAQSQDALQGDFGTVDQNANSRGLLFSGKRQSARAQAAAGRANDLGSATSQFEQKLSDTGRQINNGSYANDLNSLMQQQDLNSIASGAFYSRLQNDLGNTQGMLQGLGQAGAGVGSFAGSQAAKYKASQPYGQSGSNTMGYY